MTMLVLFGPLVLLGGIWMVKLTELNIKLLDSNLSSLSSSPELISKVAGVAMLSSQDG